MIELIVHAYAKKISAFASLLTAQLSSLMLWPPKCRYLVTVCCTPSDELTLRVLNAFAYRLPKDSLFTHELPKEKLFRRSIGRNEAARVTKADVVWFCDADYLFGEGCLDHLDGMRLPAKLCFPREYRVHRSHAIGDAEIARVVPGEVFTPDLSLFELCGVGFAIGGLQITTGDNARAAGYLDKHPKWQKRVDPNIGFQNTSEDKAYRNEMGGSSPINLPQLWRLRHSESAFEPASKRLAQTAGKT